MGSSTSSILQRLSQEEREEQEYARLVDAVEAARDAHFVTSQNVNLPREQLLPQITVQNRIIPGASLAALRQMPFADTTRARPTPQIVTPPGLVLTQLNAPREYPPTHVLRSLQQSMAQMVANRAS